MESVYSMQSNGCNVEFHSSDYIQPDNFANLINREFNSSNSILSMNNKECGRTDRVSILAYYNKPLRHECIVLIKQYRPHLNNYTIEMPTGVIEDNETPENSAVRILSDQTGYTGYVKTVGPPLMDSPSFSSQYSRIISMRIDGNDLRNSSVKSTYARDTSSKILLVPVEELLDILIEFTENNYYIDSKIDAFAIGLVKGNTARKNIRQVIC